MLLVVVLHQHCISLQRLSRDAMQSLQDSSLRASQLTPVVLLLSLYAGLIPAIQLPEIQIRAIPLTLPDLPTFEDCVSLFVNITAALRPAIEAILPTPLSRPDLVSLISSLLPQMRFEAPQIDIVAEAPRIEFPNLVGLVRAALPKLPQFPQIAVNFPQLLRLPKPQ
jgi:hypothetical protein